MSFRTTLADPPRMLVEGQRLDQPTFHALYEAMPPGTRAELINGVVLMPSPVGPAHADAHGPTLVWLDYYAENSPGIQALDNASTALGLKSEPQPDVLLRTLPEYGGRTRTDRRFIEGVPELLVEVSHTSRYTDLGSKFDDYERVGVLEYIVRRSSPTRSTGSCFGRDGSSTWNPARTEFTALRSSPGCGSTRSHSWRATGNAFVPWSTWAAPRPNTRRSSPNSPRTAERFEPAD